jgi:hypothetical protein
VVKSHANLWLSPLELHPKKLRLCAKQRSNLNGYCGHAIVTTPSPGQLLRATAVSPLELAASRWSDLKPLVDRPDLAIALPD